MAIRIQFRRGSAADWATANPVLAAGELGYESDTGQIKIGNGSTAWNALSYGAVSEAYVNDAISNVVGLAPDTLDTLNELANAIGNDPSFITSITSDISNAVSTHNGTTINVHGIANTLALETETGAQGKADLALGDAQSYTDNAIANLVESAPSTLNTLNELAAALGDDPNFATSIATTIGTKLTFVADTAENFAAANAVTSANTIYVETNAPGYLKVGNGVAHYNSLGWVGQSYADIVVTAHNEPNSNAHGIADFTALALKSQVATDISNAVTTAGVAITSEIANAITISGEGITTEIATAISTHSNVTANVHGIANTLALVADVESLQTTTGSLQTQVDAKLNTTTAASIYAPLANPTFTGNVSLPSTTSIDGVTGTEISYLDGVASPIQTQLDAKAPTADPTFTGTVSGVTKAMVGLGNVDNTSDASKPVSTATQTALDLKANSAAPTFTGTVVLPSTTSIGNVSATELGYVDGVTSAIQTQLDAKAPIADPTFTGTVSGITKAMVGLNNVNNTADANKPVSTAQQTALDLKANLSGPTFTGTVTLPATTAIGNVSAAELGYVDGVTSAIQTQLDAKAPLANATLTGTTTTESLVVTANLVVQGTTTTVSATNLEVTDSLIYLSKDQYDTDALDIGIYGAYGDSNAGHFHTGIVRDATDGVWKLISGGAEPVNNEVNFATATFAPLQVGALTAASATITSATIGSTTNTELGYVSGVTSAIQTQLNAKAPTANATLTGTVVLPSTTSIGNVSATEIGYVDGVTSAIQTQLDAKLASATAASTYAPLANATLTGTVTLPATTAIGNVSATELGYVDGVTSAIQTQLNAKAPTAAPSFTGGVTVDSSGVVFTDGTQTKAGVPSISAFTYKTGSYTLDALTLRDGIIEVANAAASTITIPLDSAVNYPVGSSIDVIQTSTGQVTIAGASGVTINSTPGLKLRTQWSSCTLLKRAANTWIVYGDLTA
jgi:hypothetical protein